MKVVYAMLFFLTIFFIGCNKADSERYGHLVGMSIFDINSVNDCSLSECDEDRIVRLIADNVDGVIVQNVITDRYLVYSNLTIDTYVNYYFCDLPDEYKEEGTLVKFSGEVVDACGVIYENWPVEEAYSIRLNKISKR